jgi:hypothetical protein
VPLPAPDHPEKGQYPMNDTMTKSMSNAANEAKAQFDAFSKVFESFIGQDGAKKAAETSAENLRAASECLQAVVGEVEQIQSGLAQHVSKTLTQAFETQAKMLTAGGWQQALEIQTAFMNASMDAGFAELSRIADHSTALLTKAGAPLQSRVDAMMKAA